MNDNAQADKLQLAVIAGALFVVWTGFGAILPYLPVYLREEGHAPVSLIGVVAAAYYLGVVCFSGPFGYLSDRLGRKPLLVLGTALYTVATALFMTTTHAAWFVCFRFLEGMGAAAVYPAGMAFVADISAPSVRSRAFGWLTSAQFAGLVLGPVLAVPLYEIGGGEGRLAFYSVFIFGSALSFAVSIVLALVLKEPVRQASAAPAVPVGRPHPKMLLTPAVAAFLVVAATSHFSVGAFEVVWSLWLRELGASMSFVGATWIAFSLPMLFSFLGGRLADRKSRFTLMFVGYGVAGIVWIFYGLVNVLPLLLVMNFVEGSAYAVGYPAKAGFLVQVSPPRLIGAVQGLEATCGQLAALVGTVVAPLLFDHIGGLIMTICGIVCLIGLASVALPLRRAWDRVSRDTIVKNVL